MDVFLQQFQHLRIQPEEITSATDNFNDENRIGVGGFGKVYKGEVSHSKGRSMVAIKRLNPKYGQGIPEFLKEITTLSRYRNENLISLLGFCYQGDEMILVYDYASRGSLDRYLNSTQLTWSQRIKICLDAAKGLSYLHDPGETHQRLIHCDVKSANILLDEQWNGKVSDFGLSIMGPANEQQSVIVTLAAGTLGYIDPLYWMTNTLTKESDVYSFGVVLFEVLCGKLCCTYSNGRVQQNLVRTWIESYEQKKLNDIIFKDMTILPLEQSALEIFSDIVYRCLKESREDRPKMAEVVTELKTALENQERFQDLRIQLEEITIATNNFNDENCIGVSGFGKVYKGELSHSKGRSTVAIKRLDPKYGQVTPEFLKEITTLSSYSHENLVSLMGFCYQGDEMLLVYEYASRGSLGCYLNSPHLTWVRRLKICLDAAKGLSYLHDPGETHQRLIHCDVKSANILLDEQWNAKVSNFRVSTIGPANGQHSAIVILAAGTPGYCDPQYAMTHTLTKESDVYSLGVVLLEVLCGRLCCTYSQGRIQQNLVHTWIQSYEQKKLNDIIFKDPTIQPLEQSALEIYSDIVYQCLKESREDRPKMAKVVTELEAALENQELLQSQEFSKWKGQFFFYKEMTKNEEPPLNYRSEVELFKLLYKGVLLNRGKMYFSLNNKGEHCEMISFAECLGLNVKKSGFLTEYNSRFTVGTYNYFHGNEILKSHVKTQFLSPGITYTVNLVFKHPLVQRSCIRNIGLKYKLQGETENSISTMAYERDDGWWMCELYQFTSDHRTIDLQILFDRFSYNSMSLRVEGIEFRPMEKVEHKDKNQPMPYSDTNWEEKMPTDYDDIMKLSENSLQWTTKKEAYSVIRKGFSISVGDKKSGIWFYLDQHGKKCYMLSMAFMRHLGTYGKKTSFPESRFGEIFQWDYDRIIIDIEVQSRLASSETTYAIYLVYKIPKDQSGFEAPVVVEDGMHGSKVCHICLSIPQTPVIRPKADQNTHNPFSGLKMKGFPLERKDGGMEVQIWELESPTTIYKKLMLNHLNKKFGKLIIEGIEFRPI